MDMKRALRIAACLALLHPAGTSLAAVEPLPKHREIDIKVSNDAGSRFGSAPEDTYYIDAPGGGLNQLHISTDSANNASALAGQVTARTIDTSFASGTFWVTTTGGRGYNDDIILLFSVIGPIADDFSLRIRSSGYQWTPSTSLPAERSYVEGAVDEVFDKADFLYGPQTAKPGPGDDWVLPFYSGQDIGDPATAQYLMFIDLNVGNNDVRSSIDSGSARVDFEVSGLYQTTASFNAYAWALNANIADGAINWTNRVSGDLAATGQSGYSIVTTAVPEPGTYASLAIGLLAVVLARRRVTHGKGRRAR